MRRSHPSTTASTSPVGTRPHRTLAALCTYAAMLSIGCAADTDQPAPTCDTEPCPVQSAVAREAVDPPRRAPACEHEPPRRQLDERAQGIACDPSVPSGSDPTAGASFSPAHILCIGVTMEPSAAASMVVESRFGRLDNGCFDTKVRAAINDCSQPWPNLFRWYSAAVEIDGVALDEIGIRKKGTLGSVYSTTPSLKLKTNKYRSGQRLGQTERVTLNNNVEDPARVSTCLTYQIFARAGYPAPRCNLANVIVNGHAQGAFSHVEAIKKSFLRRAFGNDTGHLYEGTDVDFHPSWMGHWEPKTDNTDAAATPMLGIVNALADSATDAELVAALEPHLNIDRFVTYWALEVLVGHRDGYTASLNNVYIYFDPDDGGRATFIPWSVGSMTDVSGPDSQLHLRSLLSQRLAQIPSIAQSFEARLLQLLQTGFDEDALNASLDQFAAQVRTAEQVPGFDSHIDNVRAWIRTRRTRIELMVAEGPPPPNHIVPVCGD